MNGTMRAVENLKNFLEEEQFEPNLSPQRLENLGQDLIQAAQEREGYEELVWQAGTNLLLYTNFDEEFYQRFGYRAVANALYYTFVNGDFPLGLGFIVHDFLPSGDSLCELSKHHTIQQAIDSLRREQIKVPVQNFADAAPRLREATVRFLRQGKVFGLSSHLCLQITSSLLQATWGNNNEHEAVTKLFLEMLSTEQRDINLFYCWRASIDIHQSLANEASHLSILPNIMKISRNLSDSGRGVLAQILSDEQLLNSVSHDESLLTLLGLAGWWLYVNADHERQGVSVAWQFIWSIEKKFPTLHSMLATYLEDDQLSEKEFEKIEELQQDFQRSMQKLRTEVRQRSYRGVSLAIKIYHHNLVSIFEPIYEALEGSSTLPQDVIETIENLDAYELIDENPLQKKETRAPIESNLRIQMIKDFEDIIAAFREALRLRIKLGESFSISKKARVTFPTDELKFEVRELCHQYPELKWAIEWFLLETNALQDSEEL